MLVILTKEGIQPNPHPENKNYKHEVECVLTEEQPTKTLTFFYEITSNFDFKIETVHYNIDEHKLVDYIEGNPGLVKTYTVEEFANLFRNEFNEGDDSFGNQDSLTKLTLEIGKIVKSSLKEKLFVVFEMLKYGNYTLLDKYISNMPTSVPLSLKSYNGASCKDVFKHVDFRSWQTMFSETKDEEGFLGNEVETIGFDGGVNVVDTTKLFEKLMEYNSYDNTDKVLTIRINYGKPADKIIKVIYKEDSLEDITLGYETPTTSVKFGESYSKKAPLELDDYPGYRYAERLDVFIADTNVFPISSITFDGLEGKVDIERVEDDIDIIFYYKKDDGKQIEVLFKDIDTGEELGKHSTTVPPGTNYSVSQVQINEYKIEGKDIDGYTYLKDETTAYKKDTTDEPNNTSVDKENGIVTISPVQDDINITFYYKKDDGKQIEVLFKDIDTGEELGKHCTTVPSGTNYNVSQGQINEYKIEGKDIDGYTYLKDETKAYKKDTTDEPNNTSVDQENGIVTISPVQDDIDITFYFKKTPPPPSIEVEVIPTPDIPVQKPDTAPGKEYNDKLIVLDEPFIVHIRVQNKESVPAGSKIIIKMPFDVYCLTNGTKTGSVGQFIKSGRTFTYNISSACADDYKFFFRLPSWVIEKPYVSDSNYVINSTIKDSAGSMDLVDPIDTKVGVIGRIYDLSVMNLYEGTKGTYWASSLFGQARKDYQYKADTLPIGQNNVTPNVSNLSNSKIVTQKPEWDYGILMGSKFLFSVNTKGNYSKSIKIVPKLSFYDTTNNKEARTDVTFKIRTTKGLEPFANQNGEISFSSVKFVTSINDSLRSSSTEVMNEKRFAGLLSSMSELKDNANGRDITSQYNSFNPSNSVEFGTHMLMKIGQGLRLPYINYAGGNPLTSEVDKIGHRNSSNVVPYIPVGGKATDYYDLNYLDDAAKGKVGNIGVSGGMVINSLNHWYAEYTLPTNIEVIDSNNKTIKNGYIVVSFKICALDKDDAEYISYTNEQWKAENSSISSNMVTFNTPVALGVGSINKQFNISNGYYPVAVYSLNNGEAESIRMLY